ncbi:MAG: CRISPR-associated protein Csx3 [Desulfobulbus sp.]|nr:CRISPR-associated protein Csx3 [Desulfobulbus sp.]
MIILDLSTFYSGQAKLQSLPDYEQQAQSLVPDGEDVVLTGQAPIWLYLRIAHLLHGRVKQLSYRSPITGDVLVFDHNPF